MPDDWFDHIENEAERARREIAAEKQARHCPPTDDQVRRVLRERAAEEEARRQKENQGS